MRKMADIIDVSGLQREVERRADSVGLRCVFTDKVKTAAISGNTITMPMLPVPFDMDSFRIIRMFYIHELAHWHDQPALELRRKYPVKLETNLGAMWNILQDEYDERTFGKMYKGDAKALGEGHALFMMKQLQWLKDEIDEAGGKAVLDENDHKKIAVYMLAISTRDWDWFAGPVLRAMLNTLPLEGSDIFTQLVKEGWDTRIQNIPDAQGVLDLAKLLVKRLWPEEDPDQQLKDAEAKAKGKGKGKKEGEGEGEGGGGKEAKPGESEATEGVKTKLVVIPWSAIVTTEHNLEGLSAQASRIDWQGKTFNYDNVVPANKDQYKLIPLD